MAARGISRPGEFYQVLTEAVADLEEHGFDSQERLTRWLERLEFAARASLIPQAALERALVDSLTRAYRRIVEGDRLARMHPEVSEYTLAQIKPKLRAELDRRILASASLIKLNREESVRKTLARFAGWATSIPSGGTRAVDRKAVKEKVRRSIAGLPFEERRVVIDQGHKLVAAINEIVATEGGAIAAIWRHTREGGGYQARPEHVARDGKLFVVRDNWALREGLMKRDGAKFTDEVETPGSLIYCRCAYEYLYSLRDLPSRMLTKKGRFRLAGARRAISESSYATRLAG